VPSGLTLYWFINNIISTAMQLYMRQTIKVDIPAMAAADAQGPIIDVSSSVIKPKEDRSKQVGSKQASPTAIYPRQQELTTCGICIASHIAFIYSLQRVIYIPFKR
jgi:membrane protein insertase Oxa1/YidC/SpoIIIJ